MNITLPELETMIDDMVNKFTGTAERVTNILQFANDYITPILITQSKQTENYLIVTNKILGRKP